MPRTVSPPRRRPTRRPFLEALEDRRLLALTPGVNLSTGTQLTSYTLALATTAEFTQATGGKAATQTFLNQFVGELNKIYESELAVTFKLHAQNDRLIFENAATDGYSNNFNAAMIGENPTVINLALNGSLLNDAGYDFGHVLGFGSGGGLAGTAAKGSGATHLTTSSLSEGNIKLVAHEIGHQFNASHTFNGLAGSCAGNRNALAAVEPGSGSTIMAYQGTCGSDDLGTFAGDEQYFHAASFDEILTFMQNSIPTRGTKVATGNSVPSVNAGADRTIPAHTPFALTATATDSNAADVLSYSWEQIDAGPTAVAVPIAATADGTGPLFRSFAPGPEATRVFPRLPDILANTAATQNRNEHLPTRNRDLNFRVTVRDQHAFNGKTVSGVNSDDVKLTVVNTGAAFQVTSHATANQTLAGGSQQTVTWNVAGTTANGINTSRVDILLSVDGGLTFPAKLIGQTNNDGSETITLPNVNAAKARIKVQADPTQNVFFDINDVDFKITQNANVSGGVVITESGNKTAVAEGLFVQTGLAATDTYAVALTKPPTGPVSITVSADAETEVSFDGVNFAPSQVLNFAAGVNAAQTVTLRAIDDTKAEGFHTATIRHAVTTSADPIFNPQLLNGFVVEPIHVNVSDDEAPPLIGIELDFEQPVSSPIGWNRVDDPFDVTVTNALRENGDTSPIDFRLTVNNLQTAGWSSRTMDTSTIPRHTPQLESISDVMLWDDATLTATWSDLRPRAKYRVYVFASSEAESDAVLPVKQTISITGNGTDNPAPFLQDGTGKVTGQGQFKTLHLLINGQAGRSSSNLEDFAQIVTSSADGKIVISVVPTAGTPAAASAFAIQEFLEPSPGITVVESDGKTEVTEGGTTDTFTVRLASQPGSNVVLDVLSTDTTESTVDKSSLVFTSSNWNVPQTVTVTGIDDSSVDGDINTAVHVSVRVPDSHASYSTVPRQTVLVTTKDNEQPGFTVTQSGGKTEVSETGTTDAITVVLTAQPTANVVLSVTSSNTQEATVNPATLTFTPANWNQTQTITVTGVDDAVADGDRLTNVTISVNAAQSDPRYSAVAAQVVSVKTLDNEQLGFSVTATNGSTTVTEGGATDAIHVVLTGPPAANVVFNVSINNAEATIDKAVLTFTPANWDQPQTLTVTAFDDQKVDGEGSAIVIVAVDPALSADSFDALPNQTLTVTTIDNDQPGFAVVEAGGSTTVVEAGATDTFTVVLSKQPVAEVFFNVTSSMLSEARVDKEALHFTPANWNAPQTVTVTGVQDAQVDGDKQVTITVVVDSAKSQTQFGALAAQTLSVTVKDSGVERPWHNPTQRFDVGADHSVSSNDVLRLFNELNEPKFSAPNGKLPDTRPALAAYYDVNADGFVTTNDAIQVINFLNAQGQPEGEADRDDRWAVWAAFHRQGTIQKSHDDWESVLDLLADARH